MLLAVDPSETETTELYIRWGRRKGFLCVSPSFDEATTPDVFPVRSNYEFERVCRLIVVSGSDAGLVCGEWTVV